MTDLHGKHALVTGAGSGIGAAIAVALGSAGARVTLAGRRRDPLEATAARVGEFCIVETDVTDESQVANLFDTAKAAFGPPDIVVANAGVEASGPFARTDLATWSRVINTNLTGAFLTARAALADMSTDWGRLIFIASITGLRGTHYAAPYSASKHGVVGLMRSIALETVKTGITVNAVCPGFVATPMTERNVANIVEKTGRTAEVADGALAGLNPQGRLIEAEEIADATLWLCGPGARSVNGETIAIGGAG